MVGVQNDTGRQILQRETTETGLQRPGYGGTEEPRVQGHRDTCEYEKDRSTLGWVCIRAGLQIDMGQNDRGY